MMKRLGLVAMVAVVAAGAANAAVTPGDLLDTPQDASRPIGIVPATEVQQYEPAEPSVLEMAIGEGEDLSAAEKNFHIINGPRESTRFVGKHYSGSILHSSYQEQPPDPLRIWHHYEWGPNMSLYHR
jgi:hypothetical protein